MMSAVVLETCSGDNVIYILQNKKLGASSWSQKLIYIMMHGQRNIKICNVVVFWLWDCSVLVMGSERGRSD
jgi:hypothetical protein